MDFPKVLIKENYQSFLEGKEVEAVATDNILLEPGVLVIAYHDTIAATTDITVPRQKQSQYIGMEGQVVQTDGSPDGHGHTRLIIKKV